MRHTTGFTLLCVLLLSMIGCASSELPSQRPARTFAMKERLDIDEPVESTIAPIQSSAPSAIAPVASMIPFAHEADSIIWVNRMLEIDDNPFGVSMMLTAHAVVLMREIEDMLAKNELPTWHMDEAFRVINVGQAYSEKIEPDDEYDYQRERAHDFNIRTYYRWCSLMTEINLRRQREIH